MTITHGAVPNSREGHGWIPALWIDGRRTGSTWWPDGGDLDWAHDEALRLATEEASRYIGDWDIKILHMDETVILDDDDGKMMSGVR